jgi:hypothetical protein
MEPAHKVPLDQLALETSLSRAELLHRGLRRIAGGLRSANAPGRSLDALIGSLGMAADVPSDLSARHDESLYPAPDADDARGD